MSANGGLGGGDGLPLTPWSPPLESKETEVTLYSFTFCFPATLQLRSICYLLQDPKSFDILTESQTELGGVDGSPVSVRSKRPRDDKSLEFTVTSSRLPSF